MITSFFYVILNQIFNLGMMMKLALSSIILVIVFAGCGSTSNSSNDAMDNNFTILKGTVPGTLIEAYCEDGSYHYVNSLANETGKHPFLLSLPKWLNCHLIMTTNENDISAKVITPIRFVSIGANSTVFKGVADTADLGYVALALTRADIIDLNGDGVSDINLEVNTTDGALVLVTLAVDPLDDDNDGIINVYEDDDNDGLNNKDDDDDDNDGINDDDDDGIADDEDDNEEESEAGQGAQSSESMSTVDSESSTGSSSSEADEPEDDE